MDIRLIPQHHRWFTKGPLLSSNPRCHASDAMSNSITHQKSYSVLDAEETGLHGKYLKSRLVSNVPAFFLISCGASPGYTIIPVAANERLYIVDEENGKPHELDESTTRQLINRGIWPLHSHHQATKKAINLGITAKMVQNVESHFIEKHDCLAQCSLPNTLNERQETFTANSAESPLCNLLLSHPAQIKRCITEGVYYSGYHQGLTKGQTPQPYESVSCSYCYRSTVFNSNQVTHHSTKQLKLLTAWQEAEYYLGKKNLHETDCAYRFYCGAPLVEALDARGMVLDCKLYYVANVFNTKSQSSPCIYTRLCIVNPQNQRSSLIISHQKMTEIIHKQKINRAGGDLVGAISFLSKAISRYSQTMRQSNTEFQQLYTSSKLSQAVQAYRSLLVKLPVPLTESQKAVFAFLDNAESKFARLYALYHQLDKLLKTFSYKETAGAEGNCSLSARKAYTQEISVRHFIVQTRIRRLAVAHRQVVADINSSENIPTSSGFCMLDITILPTLFPFEQLWQDQRYRQVFEAANDVLALLHELYLLDNENYLTALLEITSTDV